MQEKTIQRLVEETRKYFGLPPGADARCATASVNKSVRGPKLLPQAAVWPFCCQPMKPHSPEAA